MQTSSLKSDEMRSQLRSFHETHLPSRSATVSVVHMCFLTQRWSCENPTANENPAEIPANENPALRCQLPISQFFFDFYFLKIFNSGCLTSQWQKLFLFLKFYLLRLLRRRGADSRQRIADQPRALSFAQKVQPVVS